MNENSRLCMSCMNIIDDDSTICPHCGYNTLSVQHSPYLPKGTLLMGRYTAGKVISISADKATYIGFDSEEGKTVKIHEFLPQNLIIREPDETSVTVRVKSEKIYYDCMNSFESLWSKLSNIDAPAFDKVYDVFFLNNTAYAVCEYTDAITLKEYFDSREKLLTWQKACAAFRPLMNVLSALHQTDIIHGDLSPSSVLVGADGKLRISALNIPEAHGLIEEIAEQPYIGYAPVERCKGQSLLSPATDIYALMALIYTAVSGFVPPPATARTGGDTLMLPSQIERTMSSSAVEVFFDALEIYPSKRTDSIEKLIIALSSAMETPSEAAQAEASQPKEEKRDRRVNKATAADHTEKKKVKEEASSTSAIFFKSFVTAVIVIIMVFVTLYATVLYDYMEIPALDNALSVFTFLPVNTDREETAEPTTLPPVTDAPETQVADVVVADFTSLRYQDIKSNAIFAQNFDIIYEFEYSDDFEENAVIRQSIPFGETVSKGTTITIVISKGIEPVILKDVIGMNYEDAKAVLEDDGFVVKKKKLKNDGFQTPDEVFIMSLVAGLEFEKGTEITLSVWGKIKKEDTAEPTEKASSQSEATQADTED